ncbi:GNAT family N-acetyltransferase [Actinospica robiniae]|uniref:GNAT family N-acetyltransferase n=1 Tax=Actinospica robiniae TaxID=304901 RepID=UPI0004041F9E|nr:GNAT family N-acetyltransferase [Actinospica robiniae]
MTTMEIRDEREEHNRFSAYVQGSRIGYASWILVGETVLLPHVEVDADRHDLGIGSLLVRRVFDEARSRGYTVLALCPFAHRWADLHPAYRDVVRNPKAGELAAVNALLAADQTMRTLHRDEPKLLTKIMEPGVVPDPLSPTGPADQGTNAW